MKIEHYLPPKIRDLLYGEHCHVKVSSSLPKNIWAEYHADEDVVFLNLAVDREEALKNLSQQIGIELEPQELFIGVIFHELGHHKERLRLRDIEKIEGKSDAETLLEVRRFRGESELRATNFMITAFWNFRFDSSMTQDYRKWRDNR